MAKAQGLSVNTIILVALGLLVLVIVGALTGRKLLEFGLTTTICQGTCTHPNFKITDDPSLKTDGSLTQSAIDKYLDNARAAPGCSDLERSAPGNYIAKLKSGFNPSKYVASCEDCCVAGG